MFRGFVLLGDSTTHDGVVISATSTMFVQGKPVALVGDSIRLCGGVNIFADQKVTAPVVSIESVLQANPEAILGTSEKDYGSVDLWKPYGTLPASEVVP